MSEPNSNQDYELAGLLEALDSQVANGATPTDDLMTTLRDMPPDVSTRFWNAKKCLDLLERLWPRAAPTPFAVPERVGRFRIIRQLGFGGFGIVYQAFDDKLKRTVALKVQRPEAIISPELRRRFLREADVAARLRHPNIVGVHEVGEAGFQIWIATEYCDGDSLAAWLRSEHPPVAPEAIAAFVATLADALEYLHQRGVLHRDLKPTNVLLEPIDTSSSHVANDLGAYVPKIIDFGLAKLADDEPGATQSGARLGTPAYMAPCQASGEVRLIGPATDIYALGTIFYEMLAGQPPFQGETDLEILRQVAECEPENPRNVRPELPRNLVAICFKCLEKEPQKRYASGAALAADLRRFMEGQPTVARPPTALERLGKSIRRRPAQSALVGVAVLSALVIAIQTWVYIARLKAANDLAETSRQEAVASSMAAATNEEAARQQERIANEYLYVSRVRTGFQWLSHGEVEEVSNLLDPYETGSRLAHLRGFEWFYLKRLLHAEKATLTGHRGEVYCVVFSPDGRTLASGAEDGLIKHWNPVDGRELASIAAHKSCVNSLAYSGSGSVLASASCDRTIKLWDAATHELLATLDPRADAVECVAFSPQDDSRLASCGNDAIVRIWNVQTQEVLRELDTRRQAVGAVAWRPDGKALFVAARSALDRSHGSAVIYWNLENDQQAEFPWTANGVAVTSAGTNAYLAVADGTIRLIRNDVAVRPFVLKGHTGVLQAIAVSPKGDTLATGANDKTIQIWNTAIGRRVEVLTGHTARVQSVAFAPRGSTLASASFDGTVKLWDYNTSERQPFTFTMFVPASGPPRSFFAFSSDLRYAAVLSRHDQASVYDVRTQSLIDTMPVVGPTPGFEFLREGPVLFGLPLGTAEQFDEWDVQQWKYCQSHSLTRVKPNCFAIARDGHHLGFTERASASILDLSSGETLFRFEKTHADQGSSTPQLYSSPDGNTFGVSLENDDPSWIVDLHEKHPLQTVTGLRAVSNGARVAAVRTDAFSISLVDIRSGKEFARLRQADVTELAFSSDTKTLAVGTAGHGVALVDVATGQKITSLGKMNGFVGHLKFSVDGRSLAAVEYTDGKSYPDVTYPNGTTAPNGTQYTAKLFLWTGIEGE